MEIPDARQSQPPVSGQEAARRIPDQCRPRRTEDPKQVKQANTVPMKISRIFCLVLLASGALSARANAQQVSREQDIVDFRLGQRVLVDDGSCPAGEIKEISGSTMTA